MKTRIYATPAVKYLRFSQYAPVNPLAHEHVNDVLSPSVYDVQSAPFRQGLLSQGSETYEQSICT